MQNDRFDINFSKLSGFFSKVYRDSRVVEAINLCKLEITLSYSIK